MQIKFSHKVRIDLNSVFQLPPELWKFGNQGTSVFTLHDFEYHFPDCDQKTSLSFRVGFGNRIYHLTEKKVVECV